MFAFIKGKMVDHDENSIVLENAGIGYRILTAGELIPHFRTEAEQTLAFTSMLVRENECSLYGFPEREQCRLFELLQTVSGIGPKVACLVLGAFDSDEFAMAILNGDVKALTRVKGLGKKGAERMILELKDKLKKLALGERPVAQKKLAGQAGGAAVDGHEELMTALLVLGYTQKQAVEIADNAFDPALDLQSNLKAALKLAAQKN